MGTVCFCLIGLEPYEVVSPKKITPGRHQLVMIFDYDGGPPGSGECGLLGCY